MFTTTLPPDILPIFPSWSLIILGSASLYQPAKGVEQVGYFAGSNYLLLWDIPVDVTACNDTAEQNPPPPPIIQSQEELWPAPGEIVKPKAAPPPAQNTHHHHHHHHQGQHSPHLPLLQTINKYIIKSMKLVHQHLITRWLVKQSDLTQKKVLLSKRMLVMNMNAQGDTGNFFDIFPHVCLLVEFYIFIIIYICKFIFV